MTKPLPTSCIKDDGDTSWQTFNFLLESVSSEDNIGHLYIADIEFDYKNVSEREFTDNEIYPPIIEKHKTIDPCERSVFQLLEQFVKSKKGPRAYRVLAKARANLFKKIFWPMYLEDLVFCIKRTDWKVTKIHSHLAFEQARFKKKFMLMNQKSRQESKNSIEKDFYKLMNNSNFGYDCRNNIDNCKFVPIFDQYNEITFINQYRNVFDEKVSQFVTSDLLKEQIEETYNDKLMKLDPGDRFYEIELETIKSERLSSLEAAEKLDQSKKKLREEQHYMIMSIEKTRH